jgi:putative SOS response-associated peptidase YedK
MNMCGRFTSKEEKDALLKLFQIDIFDIPPVISYNIAPGQVVGAIINAKVGRHYTPLIWGLIPSWSKDPKIGYKMINARSETVAEKPSYKAPFKRRRCLVPANGFYEWKKTGKNKQPYFIGLKSGEMFSMGGIWDIWSPPEGGEVHTLSILTTKAIQAMEHLHDRSPLIIPKEHREEWLSTPETDYKDVMDLLKPYDRFDTSREIRMYPVSKKVNSPKNNSPDCIKPLNGDNPKDDDGQYTIL